MGYDVIIAGGSFAGLAVAAQLLGRRVLLVEPHAVGAVQTSACGTLQAVLEATGMLDSLCQIHDRFVLHLRDRTIDFPLPYPFCTFDYRTFCQRLLAQGDAEILHASVLGHRGHVVRTTKGTFDAEILVDATGWRAALATCGRQRVGQRRGMSFGMEAVIPVTHTGLHFFYDPRRLLPFGAGWLFPAGSESRAGFASYLGRTQLGDPLGRIVRMAAGRGAPSGPIHGGYFPYWQQPAVTGHIFRVGDAAGQCFPLTGEGIRPALYFGAAAGRLARRVLDGELREPEALREYRAFAGRHIRVFRRLLAAQRILPRLPDAQVEQIAAFVRRPHWLHRILKAYWAAVDPDRLALIWAGERVSATSHEGLSPDPAFARRPEWFRSSAR